MRGQTAGGLRASCFLSLLESERMEMLPVNGTDFRLSEYSFERRFDERGAIEWMQANW